MQRQYKLNKLLLKLLKQSLIKKTIHKIITPWYSIALIDRWLLGQIIPPMLFAISAFTVISLSVGVMFDLIGKIVEFGLPPYQAIKALFYSLPSFLVLSFPDGSPILVVPPPKRTIGLWPCFCKSLRHIICNKLPT